jgi:predicted HNH restriction endonuclease
MPVRHNNSTAKGKDLCDSFFSFMSTQIPGLKRIDKNQGCALRLPEKILLYVDHPKTRDSIKVWPHIDILGTAELKSFVAKSGLIGTPRKKISGSWARRFPLTIELESHEDIKKAAEVLRFANADQYEPLADELPEPDLFPEGGRRTVIINGYERSVSARNACIKHYGPKCLVCGLDFEKRYGKMGRGFIHVHHIVEISKIGKKYKINPKKDLQPVCPNCHAMLHRNDPMLSIEELKALLIER